MRNLLVTVAVVAFAAGAMAGCEGDSGGGDTAYVPPAADTGAGPAGPDGGGGGAGGTGTTGPTGHHHRGGHGGCGGAGTGSGTDGSGQGTDGADDCVENPDQGGQGGGRHHRGDHGGTTATCDCGTCEDGTQAATDCAAGTTS